MGLPLFSAADEAAGVATGDIEDDGCVRCPHHGRRVDVRTGSCDGQVVQRTYPTRLLPAPDGSAVLEVDVSRLGSLASDAYVRRADIPLTSRGDAAAATSIFRGDAAAGTWTFRGDAAAGTRTYKARRYNASTSPCVERARRARAAVTPPEPERHVRRRLEYDSDDSDG